MKSRNGRRSGAIAVIAVLLLSGAGYAIWRLPAVQEKLLEHASLSSLGNTVAEDPTNWRAQYWYGRRLAESGDFPNAEKALRTALGSHPDDLPGLTALGKVLLAEHRVEEAFQFLQMAAGRDPKNADARVALAFLYRSQGAPDRALQYAQEALALQPGDVRALYEVGAAQVAQQEVTRAEETLRKALVKAPDDLPSLVLMSRVLLARNNVAEAEAKARRAVQLHGDNVDALVALSDVLARKQPADQNRKEALSLLAHAQDLEPTRPEVPRKAARLLADAGRWSETLDATAAAIRLDPSAAEPYFIRSQALQHLGRMDESRQAAELFRQKDARVRQVEALKVAIGTNPNDAKLRFKLGDVYAASGRTDLAIAAYRQGLDRAPSDAAARNRMKELLQKAVQK